MVRFCALFILLAVCLAGQAAASRSVLQAAAPKQPAECKPTVVKTFKKPLCVAQAVKEDAKSPAVVVQPTSIRGYARSANAACVSLGYGFAVMDQSQHGTTAVACFNGKADNKGLAWTILGCCKAGTVVTTGLARDRGSDNSMRSFGGQDAATMAGDIASSVRNQNAQMATSG